MKGFVKTILVGSSILVVCWACQPDPTVTEAALPYHFIEFVRYSETCQEDSTRCAVFKAQYPKYDSAESTIRERINESILSNLLKTIADGDGTKPESLSEIAKEFFKDYEEFAVGGFAMPWELECYSKVLYSSSNLFSVAMDSYRFMGGAHPNSFRSIFNFDLKNGVVLSLEDVITDIPAFITTAEQQFRKSQGLDEAVSFQDAGFFMEEFKASTQFALTEDGLLLFYNTYEIAPYAAGPTEILIPYEALQGIINPTFYPKES